MMLQTIDVARHFMPLLDFGGYDLVIIRGDRFEMMPIANMAAVRNIPIAHLEGGDLSGAIDNKIRYAISALADLHFPEDKESYARLIKMGIDPDKISNFGSIGVEYALQSLRGYDKKKENHIVLLHHALDGEDPEIIKQCIIDHFGEKDLIVIKSNSDNGEPFGDKEFPPEDYLKLIASARMLVGNSSSFLKEASIFGTPVVLVGDRQKNRHRTHNVKDSKLEYNELSNIMNMQWCQEYEPDYFYYKQNTSSNIANRIKEFLQV